MINLLENKENAVKYYTWCGMIYDNFDNKIQSRGKNKKYTKFQFYFVIILIQIKFTNNNRILCEFVWTTNRRLFLTEACDHCREN